MPTSFLCTVFSLSRHSPSSFDFYSDLNFTHPAVNRSLPPSCLHRPRPRNPSSPRTTNSIAWWVPGITNNTLRHRNNSGLFLMIFYINFLVRNGCIVMLISLKLDLKEPLNNVTALVSIMAYRRNSGRLVYWVSCMESFTCWVMETDTYICTFHIFLFLISKWSR